MRYLLAIAITLLTGPALAQDYNLQCYDGQGAGVYFVGGDASGAALFFDTGYTVTQDYSVVFSWGPNVTVYRSESATMMLWETNGSTMIWSYPQGQRSYYCE